MKVLLSGFDPIWSIKRTPSGDLAKLWQQGVISCPGVEVVASVLPQLFGKATEMLCSEITAHKPNIVLMFGATHKNNPLRLERFAINVEKSSMGDNSRIPVKDRPILREGPPAYESTLPILELINSLGTDGVSCKASYHAGTHCCNSLMYGVLHFLTTVPQPHPIIAGFMYISFPNEYGVIEDDLWTTSSFAGIVEASIKLIDHTSNWYKRTYQIP